MRRADRDDMVSASDVMFSIILMLMVLMSTGLIALKDRTSDSSSTEDSASAESVTEEVGAGGDVAIGLKLASSEQTTAVLIDSTALPQRMLPFIGLSGRSMEAPRDTAHAWVIDMRPDSTSVYNWAVLGRTSKQFRTDEIGQFESRDPRYFESWIADSLAHWMNGHTDNGPANDVTFVLAVSDSVAPERSVRMLYTLARLREGVNEQDRSRFRAAFLATEGK